MSTSIRDGNRVRTETWVKDQLKGHDSSHDWWHIHRVRNMALRLAREEGVTPSDTEVVELAALLHDVGDHKYSCDPEGDTKRIEAFLEGLELRDVQRQSVMYTIKHMGFKEELSRECGSHAPPASCSLPFAAVQDADRLDAIGAIGIARCLTFGGKFDRVLHDPAVPPRQHLTKQQYMDKSAQQTTINHFYEKLLHLQGLMKTAAGRRVAQQRHEYMEGFLRQLMAEWEGEA